MWRLLPMCAIAAWLGGCGEGWQGADALGPEPSSAPGLAQRRCGDGVKGLDEACDPGVRASTGCEALSSFYVGGLASCRDDCRWDTTRCESRPVICGDGWLGAGEACDPTAPEYRDGPAWSCTARGLGYDTGRVRCTDECGLDYSDCRRGPGVCGDGVIDPGELCDPASERGRGRCTDDCRPLINGRPGLIEAPIMPGFATRAIINPGYACRDLDVRGSYRERPPVTLLYHLEICERDSGGAAHSPEAVRTMMEAVAEIYLEAGIVLVEESLDRFSYEAIDCVPGLSDMGFYNFIQRRAPQGVVGIALVSGISSPSREFNVAGYARPGGIVVLTGPDPQTAAHELGHFLGLAHTHDCTYGVETAETCRNAGDLICDTPPDPGADVFSDLGMCADGSTRVGTCESEGCGLGQCPGGERPDRDNLMSYYNCWPGHFSVEQLDFMRCMLDEELLPFGCSPRPEVCNGNDDDCDGKIDDGLDSSDAPADAPCPTLGVCANGAAREVCSAGAWRCELPSIFSEPECEIVDAVCGIGDPSDATCSDRLDNDCDGETDEQSVVDLCRAHPDYARVERGDQCWESTLGRCGRGGGVFECVRADEGCGITLSCTKATGPQSERCDGQDWDCNGRVDDRNDEDGDGFGNCPGRVDCDETRPEIHPGADEICDGHDNDCDAIIDEDLSCP